MHPLPALSVVLLQGLPCSSLAVSDWVTRSTVRPLPDSPPSDCTRLSQSPSWSVLNLTYTRLNFGPPCVSPSGFCGPPDGSPPQPLYYGELALDILNEATRASHHCDVRSLSLSDLYADYEWLPCRDAIIFIMVPEYVTDTMFRFSHASNTLELNQTWSCGDGGDNFTAVGTASPVLDPGAKYIGDRSLGEVHVAAVSPVIKVQGTLMR